MLKVTIYIEKNEFDKFFQWINRLNNGTLTTSTVEYSHDSAGFKEPLQLSLEPRMYNLIKGAESDIESIANDFGDIELDFEPLSQRWELRTISDVLRNSRRYDIEADLVYTALYTMSVVPGLTPSEAMIIAEREWVTNKEK